MLGLIQDFKMTDTCDILQSEYDELDTPIIAVKPVVPNIVESITKTLYMPPKMVHNSNKCIEDFITCIKQPAVEHVAPPPIPTVIKEVDLRRDELRSGRWLAEPPIVKTIQPQYSNDEPNEVKKVKKVKRIKKIKDKTDNAKTGE
jgi:hypothetical protein